MLHPQFYYNRSITKNYEVLFPIIQNNVYNNNYEIINVDKNDVIKGWSIMKFC